MRVKYPGTGALINLSATPPLSHTYKMDLKQTTTAMAADENVAKQNSVKAKLENSSAFAL